MMTMLLATRNAHKAGEIQAILGAAYQLLSLNEFPGAPGVVEDAPTFAGNARKKAGELAAWLAAHPALIRRQPAPRWVLADDSGLEVDALHGAPGVRSARFAAADPQANARDADNNAKLLRLLHGVPAAARTARFRCVLALADPGRPEPAARGASPVCGAPEFGAEPLVFEGVCEGAILESGRGRDGFGYDPLFVPAGENRTFAELGDDVKNRLSHRAKALAALRVYLSKPET